LERHSLSDLGNAKLFIDQAEGKLLYSPGMGWLAWDGRRWTTASQTKLFEVTEDVINLLHSQANSDPSNPQLKQHAAHSEAYRSITAMHSLAQMSSELHVSDSDFDSNPHLINVLNGTLNLKTGKLHEHSRDDRITMLADVEYVPGFRSTIWDRFIRDICTHNRELMEYMQRAVGYALTGYTSAQCMFILYGEGANGKSTLVEAVRATLGDYAKSADPNTLMAQSGTRIRNDIARLRGSRFLSATESSSHGKLDETMIKQLTGNDVVPARFLYRETFELRPTWKIFLSTNHKPTLEGVDYAIWRRIRLVPFEATFKGPTMDRNLLSKILMEKEAVLVWALAGCRKWMVEGIETPDKIRRATAAYRAEMDIVGEFIDESCYRHQEATVKVADLYEVYMRWCRGNHEKPLSTRDFSVNIKRRFQGEVESERTSIARYWSGLGLKKGVTLGILSDDDE